MVLTAETSSDGAFHIHSKRLILSSQPLLLLRIAHQLRRCEQASGGDVATSQSARANRRPAMPLEINHFGCQYKIADMLLRLQRSGKASGYQQTRSIGPLTEAQTAQTPAQGRRHRRRPNAGFQHQDVRSLDTSQFRMTRSIGETLLKRISAAKVQRFAAQGEDHTGDRESVFCRHQDSCHISIFRLSPIRLLTPSAAEGS